jgi:fatty acid desaturase
MVNVGNAKLADRTGSRAWISVVAAAACFLALAIMVAHCLIHPEHLRSLWLMLGVVLAPLLYQLAFRARIAHARAGA